MTFFFRCIYTPLVVAGLLTWATPAQAQPQYLPSQLVTPMPFNGAAILAAATLNAATESATIQGYLQLQAGTGTKTLSAAGGGRIIVYTGATTFATASSELRVGIEDITAGTGIPDGTQDAYGAKVAGTDTITANSYTSFTMTSGTTTRSHNDFLTVSVRMPVRAGADSVNIGVTVYGPTGSSANVAPFSVPYGSQNGSKTTEALWAFIVFDDGTYGWIDGTVLPVFRAVTQATTNTGTTPDEYVCGFEVTSPTEIGVIGWMVDDVVSGDNYDIRLFSDPYGSPSVLGTVSFTAALTGTDTAVRTSIGPITPVVAQPGTTYGVGLRPTTANSISVTYEDLGSGFDILKATIPTLQNVTMGSRVDNSGAFTVTQTYHVPTCVIGITGGSSSSGGSRRYIF